MSFLPFADEWKRPRGRDEVVQQEDVMRVVEQDAMGLEIVQVEQVPPLEDFIVNNQAEVEEARVVRDRRLQIRPAQTWPQRRGATTTTRVSSSNNSLQKQFLFKKFIVTQESFTRHQNCHCGRLSCQVQQ